LGRELSRSLADRNIVPRLVADRPPEWRLGRLTVVVAGQRARLRYARQPVGATGASAAEIAAAWQRALARLEARSLPPEALLGKLAAAYRALAAGSNDRVPLVAVRAELGYGRAQFAWDVARLRCERRLIVDGHRVDLGVATGMATSRRSRVVWIEDEGGSGAFYETLRLMEVRT
jgi:hypothetical protein